MSAPPDPGLARRLLLDPLPLERALREQLTGADNVREAAWRLAEVIGTRLGLDDCVVYVARTQEPVLIQVAAWGHKRISERLFENPIRLPFGRGIVGACARDAVPVLVADTRLDPRYVIDDQIRLSELAVPILQRGVLLGVIDSEHRSADAYRSDHIRLILRLADVFADWLARNPTRWID